MVRNKDDINLFSNTVNSKIIPIFSVSNKKGVNLDKFIHFLRTLPFNPKETLGTNNQNELNAVVRINNLYLFQFEVTKSYLKEKKKIIDKDIVINMKEKETTITKKFIYGVLIGIMAKGELIVGAQYKLGPFNDGSYKYINI